MSGQTYRWSLRNDFRIKLRLQQEQRRAENIKLIAILKWKNKYFQRQKADDFYAICCQRTSFYIFLFIYFFIFSCIHILRFVSPLLPCYFILFIYEIQILSPSAILFFGRNTFASLRLCVHRTRTLGKNCFFKSFCFNLIFFFYLQVLRVLSLAAADHYHIAVSINTKQVECNSNSNIHLWRRRIHSRRLMAIAQHSHIVMQPIKWHRIQQSCSKKKLASKTSFEKA